jgi:hypothetical protein
MPLGRGTRLYSYGIARDRRVGLLIEPLCYIVVVTVPVGTGLGEEDVRTIMESFRFR